MKARIALLAVFVAAVSVAGPVFARQGMTWGFSAHDNALGIDRVGCGSCNAYQGDTDCSVALPILCLKVDGSPRPNYAVPATCGGVMPCTYYNGWAGGHVATTVPVAGINLNTATAGDYLCQVQFGSGWKMAEHHNGRWVSNMGLNRYYGNAANWRSTSIWPTSGTSEGGWNFYAYGNVTPNTRYWVNVIGQQANCWN